MRLCTMLWKTVFGLLGVRRQGSECAAGPDGSGAPARPNRCSERPRLECRQPVHLSRGGRGQELPDGPKTPNPSMQASRCCGQHRLDGFITNAAVAGIVF